MQKDYIEAFGVVKKEFRSLTNSSVAAVHVPVPQNCFCYGILYFTPRRLQSFLFPLTRMLSLAIPRHLFALCTLPYLSELKLSSKSLSWNPFLKAPLTLTPGKTNYFFLCTPTENTLESFLILLSLNCIDLLTCPPPQLDRMLLENKDYVLFLSIPWYLA